MKKKIFVLCIALSGLCSRAFSQQENLNRIQQQFSSFATANPQEKLFVHTDKEFYLVGEIIWFRIHSDKKSMLSGIGYVDITGTGNRSVAGAKVSLKESEDNGSILIPLSVNSGIYTLRGYTNWMKNDEGSFFEKKITIINPFKNPDTATQRKVEGYEVHFFPEGGNLVKGLQSRVAFKITDKYGKGIEGKGQVMNEKNETVASFSSFRFGMGSFHFTPQEKNHTAVIETADGNRISIPLPAVYDNGYVMTATSKAGNIEVRVKSSYTGPQNISLIGRLHDEIRYAETGIMTDGSFTFTVPTEKTGKGVIQFTLFNAVNQAVCERLVFVRPPVSTADIAADNSVYGNRKKIQLSILTKNPEAKPVASDMSVAVFPMDPLQNPGQTDIASYFLLTSELKGHIESPGYYFSSDEGVEQATDNLMLTHGWRRYNWDKAMRKQWNSLFSQEYDAHSISVLVTDKSSRQPLPDKEVFLSVPGTAFDFTTSVTNNKGIATFNLKELYGSSRIVVQVKDIAPGSYNIEVLSPFYRSTGSNSPFYLPNQDSILEKYSINMQVQNIFNADSMRVFYAHESKDSLSFYGKAPYGYNLDAYTRFTTMEEVLREYVREINVSARNGKLYLRILDEGRKEFNENDILVLWDGVPVQDPHSIFNFDPLKVKRLEVIPRRFAAGGSFFKGIASFTTYTGDLAGYNLPPGTFSADYDGLQLQREFYSPVYETAAQLNSRMPDFRNTLYWSPAVSTNAKGETKLQFYTGDRKGKYLVVLQGLDENGNPLVTTTTFEVK